MGLTVHPSVARAYQLIDRIDREQVEREAAPDPTDAWPATQPDVRDRAAFQGWLERQPQTDVVLERGAPELVYRTMITPPRQEPQTMDHDTSAAWNAWAQGLVDRAIADEHETVIGAVGEALAMIRYELRTEFRDEIAKLRAEIDGKVTSLPTKRDAA